MGLRYGYVQTRSRWHRVTVDASGIRSLERCNLDDARMRSKVVDAEPKDARRCLHCHDEDEVVDDDEPASHPATGRPGSKRRLSVSPALAAAALLAATSLGAVGGVLLSPDEVNSWPTVYVIYGTSSPTTPTPSPNFPSPTPTSSGEPQPSDPPAPTASPSPLRPSPVPRPAPTSAIRPSPSPTATPTPTPCPHPGLHVGLDDPCKWKGGK